MENTEELLKGLDKALVPIEKPNENDYLEIKIPVLFKLKKEVKELKKEIRELKEELETQLWQDCLDIVNGRLKECIKFRMFGFAIIKLKDGK